MITDEKQKDFEKLISFLTIHVGGSESQVTVSLKYNGKIISEDSVRIKDPALVTYGGIPNRDYGGLADYI